jgi:ABC-type sugar transport system ATPase subunit
VTHDQVEAMTLADRIAVLDDGVLQQVDAPMTVYNSPTNRFVAGFIGTPPMVFLEELEDGCVVGVRPSDVMLGTGPIQATVDVVEPLGAQSFVHLRVGTERIVAMGSAAVVPGSEIAVQLQNTHRFCSKTGVRLP